MCLELSARDLTRWNLASNYFRSLESRIPDLFKNDPQQIKPWYDLPDDEIRNLELPIPLDAIATRIFPKIFNEKNMLTYRASNVRNIYFDNLRSSRVLMVVVPIAYGAIHLSALTIAFPTAIEHLLWKSACYSMIGVAGGLAVILIMLPVSEISEDIRSYMSNLVRHFPKYNNWTFMNSRVIFEILSYSKGGRIRAYCIVLPIYLIFFASSILYIAARAYIVIESFISLRYVPIEVYETPQLNFMNYVPHL